MACILDASILSSFSEKASVGLLLGLGAEKSGIYLVPTPANPSADASVKKLLDKDWILEHAFQVSRMLTGNIEIIGIFYVAENLESITPLETQLHAVVKSIASQCKATSVRKLVEPRFFVCELFSADKTIRLLESDIQQKPDQPGKECSLNLHELSPNIHSFEARVFIDVEVPLRSGIRLALRDQIKKGLQVVERNLSTAVVTMEGAAVTEDKPLSTLKNKVHSVELFCDPFPGTDIVSGAGTLEAVVRYSGTIAARAYCLSTSTVHAAVERLKADMVDSVHIRLEALCEEFSATTKGANLDALSLDEANLRGKEEKWILQRRVFVPLIAPVMLSDYLSADETLQDCEARCVELLGLTPPAGSNIEKWLVPGESLFGTASRVKEIAMRMKVLSLAELSISAVAKPEKIASSSEARSPVASSAEKGAKVKHDLQAKMKPLKNAQPTIPTRIYAFIALAVLIAVAAFYFQYWLVSHYQPE